MSKIKERRVWYFTCDVCKKKRRQSHKKHTATDALCRECRRSAVAPNQTALFNEYEPETKAGEEKI